MTVRFVGISCLCILLAACGTDDETSEELALPAADEVEIRYTDNGIPHIRAANWESAAFGAGYAFSRDHICTLADQMVKIRGERARYFGPGDNDEHIDSDFAYLHLHYAADGALHFDSLDAELAGMLEAYADGVNRYLEETGPQGLPSPCRGADWVQPITGVDMLGYYLQLGGQGSGKALASRLATAEPPTSKGLDLTWDELGPEVAEQLVENLPNFRNPGYGSNGWGLGSEMTETGRGALLSNTHFPSEGELQWWEMHVDVADSDDAPGTNAYGASLMGVFPLNMGFNEHVAWTHTVSGSPRLTGYLLELDPEAPTRYRYDEDWREMTSEEYTIDVLLDDGSLEQRSRTLWRTHYGPMVDIQPLGWTSTIGITYRDANEVNLRMLPQWLEMNRSTSLDEFAETFIDIGGIPWVHTLASDAEGEVFYIDAGSVPNLSAAAYEGYQELLENDAIVQAASSIGFVLLDGSDSTYEWVETDAERPGLVPGDEAPTLRRRDFVANSNDSHWATNPRAPLEGYHPLFGTEREAFFLPRTRMGLIMLTEDSSPHAGDDGWSAEEILAAATSGRASLSETILGEMLERCATFGSEYTFEFDGEEVTMDPQTEICAVLEGWDGVLRLESAGAALWRQAMAGSAFADSDVLDAGVILDIPFDPDSPVDTPRGLVDSADANALLLDAFAQAARTLESVGINPAAPLGDVQFQRMHTRDYPRIGGLEREGAFAIADWRGSGTMLERVERAEVVDDRSGLTEEGWPVNAGNSWVMAMEFTDDGPRGHALMTYGQSEDPESPHYDDQAARYSELDWRPLVYEWEELEQIEPLVLTR